MGWLKVLNGDEGEKYFWNPESSTEVQIAREKFEHYMKQGFIVCKIVDQGRTGVQLGGFDPEAGEIFMLGLADGG